MSVNTLVNVAAVNVCVLTSVMTRSDVPPSRIELGENDFSTVGDEGLMVSVSVAAQIPVVVEQPGVELVFVTPAGGVMRAVLLTCV